jgi:hypothetical protein
LRLLWLLLRRLLRLLRSLLPLRLLRLRRFLILACGLHGGRLHEKSLLAR